MATSSSGATTSVSDQSSFDPDPAFYAEYQSVCRVLMTKNCKKFIAEKKFV
jgi:hypothetical protein